MALNIDLHKERAFVFFMFNEYKIPLDVQEEYYQDFVVFFLETEHQYSEEYATSTILSTSIRSFMSMKAREFNSAKRGGDVEYLEDHVPDYIEGVYESSKGYSEYNTEETYTYVQELLKDASDDLKEYLAVKAGSSRMGSWAQDKAKEKGVTRQSIEKKLKKELEKIQKRGLR